MDLIMLSTPQSPRLSTTDQTILCSNKSKISNISQLIFGQNYPRWGSPTKSISNWGVLRLTSLGNPALHIGDVTPWSSCLNCPPRWQGPLNAPQSCNALRVRKHDACSCNTIATFQTWAGKCFVYHQLIVYGKCLQHYDLQIFQQKTFASSWVKFRRLLVSYVFPNTQVSWQASYRPIWFSF